MEENERVYQKTEDVQIKKMGMSVLGGLLFGLVAGMVIIVILVVFKQEVMPNADEPVAQIETTDGGSLSDISGQNEGKQPADSSGENIADDKDLHEVTSGGENGADETSDINEMNSDSEIDMTDATASKATVVTDVTEVVDRVMPCVVSIFGTYTMEDDFWGYFYDYEAEGGGSGIIVGENDTELLIATNNHVVEDSEELTVQFIDASVASASVKGTDKDMDLAVIAISLTDLDPATKKMIRIATLGNSDYLKVGEPAIAIGNALGYGQSVTTGVISAVNRAYTDNEGPLYGTENSKDASSKVKYLIQTDAAINPGNSGGALLNVRGEVIGINSSKIADYATEGMGYAIPISTAEPILKDLMQKKTRPVQKRDDSAYLGISGMAVTGELLEKYNLKEGIYITQVFDETPAQRAGIHKGDILLEIDGYTVGDMDDLTEVLSYYEEGDSVTVNLLTRTSDGYQTFDTTVKLGGK